MPRLRRTSTLLAALLLAPALATVPGQADADAGPTTLAVDGTLRVIAVDSFGAAAAGAHDQYLYSVETDRGTEIPVALDDEDVPANGRFTGELVVAGQVAEALDDRDLLPRRGSTIDEDSRAGQVAVAAAEDAPAPLVVESSSVAPAAVAAAAAPAAHQVYVAVLDNRGSVEETDAQVAAYIDEMTGYWSTESSGQISSFAIQGAVRHFSSTAAGAESTSCGMGSPSAVWNEAAALFPGVSFSGSSRNHLVVAMADECSGSGIAGVASVGTDFSSGGRLSFSMGGIAEQVGKHEIGHTFGLGHANLDTCAGMDDCEYWDLYSPMALAVSGKTLFTSPALGTLYRVRLGSAVSGEVGTVTLPASGASVDQTFTLNPRGSATGQRGLLVTDPSTGTTYSVDYRERSARDTGTFYGSGGSFGSPTPTYPAGIVVERANGGETFLMTRGTSPRAAGAFITGTTFSPTTGLSVSVVSTGATAQVRVVLTGTATQPAPVGSSTPTISGSATVDRTVTAGTAGWESGTSFTYDWRVDGASTGSTGSTYTIPASAAGKPLMLRVTGTRSGRASVVRESAAVTVLPPPSVGSATPTISGSATVDRTVTAGTAGWESGASLAYDWRLDGVSTGSAGTSFTLPASAAGRALTVRVTGSKPGTTPATQESAPTAVASGTMSAARPRVSGTSKVGRTLKVKVGTWAPKPSFTYRWFANGRAITSKGTKASFRLTTKQKGKRITVRVTGRAPGYTPAATTSAATRKVARK